MLYIATVNWKVYDSIIVVEGLFDYSHICLKVQVWNVSVIYVRVLFIAICYISCHLVNMLPKIELIKFIQFSYTAVWVYMNS